MSKEEVKKSLCTTLDTAMSDYGVEEYYRIDDERDDRYLYLITDIKFENAPSFRDFEDAYLVVCQAVEEIWGIDETPDAVNYISTMIENGYLVFVFDLNLLNK